MSRTDAIRLSVILGLPHLRPGPLLERARELGAPVLISANALSRWRTEDGIRMWTGWDRRPLALARGMRLALDSAGFVAMARYRGFHWTVQQYIGGLAAQADLDGHPFIWFSSMDLCVEPEVAPDRDEVLDRVAGTANLNKLCFQYASDLGISDRLMPVIQGWHSDDYRRCLDLVPFSHASLIGVGSMCRRQLAGETGIIACVEAIDRELGDHAARLHLFGLKGAAAAALRGHPRVASIDSQAYGVRARRLAWEEGCSKTDEFLADVMEAWYRRLQARLAEPGWKRRLAPIERPLLAPVGSPFEERLAEAREELRDLIASGELDYNDVSFHWLLAMVGDD